ncbi:EI24 domain-containing protein [Bailinhaonella thermotolerans]|uniref:CysZ protein n=1 Tax=Bailinhaonella thermotolerans TaxID=1070861 RepID=A0A3A4AZB8_9ACTN|nr:EI24 domain-containing protein [Bailinhaonella thermotolerans]RJL34473.1 hypothetical protein D5H75_08620 [Bailinhaonella thermotolerans]
MVKAVGRKRGLGGFVEGAGCFLRGLGWVAARPRQWLFGLIPALIAFVLYGAALVLLGIYAGDLAELVTPFADGWSAGVRDGFRAVVGVLVFAAGLVLSVFTFTAVTLLIGDPFYEKLSERVEDSLGGAPRAPDVPLWREIARSARDSLVTLVYVVLFTIPLFVLGFVPVVGQTVTPVLGALVSGFFLAVELTSLPLVRRGLRRRERFALLRRNLSATLGFGTLVFLVFLIPLAAVIAMPGAVAGAAMLTRARTTDLAAPTA